MSDTFKYKIEGWNPQTKMVRVSLEDGQGWADVQLMHPFPKSIEELDKIVRTYSMPKEILEARTGHNETDLSWLEGTVGVEREAERFSFYKASGRHKVDEMKARLESMEVQPPADADNPLTILLARIEKLEQALAKKTTKKAA